MIYTTFEQWADGNFMETGEPRRKAYSQAELDLIEMGWNYGHDAGVEKEREACAKLCEVRAIEYDGFTEEQNASEKLAIAIRARGQQ